MPCAFELEVLKSPEEQMGLEASNLGSDYPSTGRTFLRDESLKYLKPVILFEITSY